jgi:hypothetical protein
LPPTSAGLTRAPEEIIILPFDTTVSGTIAPRVSDSCTLGEPQYVIQYPGGATRVKIEISTASPQVAANLVVFARFGQKVTTEGGRLLYDVGGPSSVPLYFPTAGAHLFEAGTYFIALRNCGTDPIDFAIRASLLLPPEADTAPLTDETSFGAIPPGPPGACSLSQTQYRVDAPGAGPCSGLVIGISAKSDQNIALYARRDQRVVIEDGHIVADLTAALSGTSQFIDLTTRGTYYIAVGNCSPATANYALNSFQAIIDPPTPAFVNGCSLVREPNGRFVLDVYGGNMSIGATVTVGGKAPKKVKFIELEDGSITTYKHIRLVKKFCGGLPGSILVINPGPCRDGNPFFCGERCPD